MTRNRRRGFIVTGIVLAVALAGAAAVDYWFGFDAEVKWQHSLSDQDAGNRAAIARWDAKFTAEATQGWYSDPVLNQPVLAAGRAEEMRRAVSYVENPAQLMTVLGDADPLPFVAALGERGALHPSAMSIQRSKAQAATRIKEYQSFARLMACGKGAGHPSDSDIAFAVTGMSFSDRYPHGASDALVAQVLAEARKFCAPAK